MLIDSLPISSFFGLGSLCHICKGGYADFTWRLVSGAPTTQHVAIQQGIKVYLDGTQLEFAVAPIVVNGRTLVPMRTIFEALGFVVQWDRETQSVAAVLEASDEQMMLGLVLTADDFEIYTAAIINNSIVGDVTHSEIIFEHTDLHSSP